MFFSGFCFYRTAIFFIIMKIEIKRLCRSRYAIDGELKISGMKVCDTAENVNCHLPPGTYPIRLTTCRHYHRKMPCIITDESDCCSCPKLGSISCNTTLPKVCPQIKIGNGVNNREDGSIIIGERIVSGAMAHPAEHFNRLIDRLEKAVKRKEEITLSIR